MKSVETCPNCLGRRAEHCQFCGRPSRFDVAIRRTLAILLSAMIIVAVIKGFSA